MRQHSSEMVVSSYAHPSLRQLRGQNISEHIQVHNSNLKYINECARLWVFRCVHVNGISKRCENEEIWLISKMQLSNDTFRNKLWESTHLFQCDHHYIIYLEGNSVNLHLESVFVAYQKIRQMALCSQS